MNEQNTIGAAKPRSAGAAVKALAWREWRLVRKDFISSMSIFIVLTALFWLIRLSMSVGNLAPVFEGSEMLGEFNAIIYYASISLVGCGAAALGMNTAALPDIQANWLPYSFALPITPRMRATGIYIVKISRMLTGSLFAILNAFVTAKITGMTFSAHTVWLIAAFSAAFLLYDTLLTFFATKARTAKGMEWANFKAMAVVVVPVLIISLYNYITDPNADDVAPIDESIEKARTLFLAHESVIRPVTVLVLIGCLLLGWFLTMRHYKMYGDVNEREKAQKKQPFTLFKTQKDGEKE